MRRFVSFGPAFVVLLTVTIMMLAAPAAVQRFSLAHTAARVSLARQTIADDDILQRIDRAVSAIAEAVEPSVVHIDVSGSLGGFGPGSSGSGWVYDDWGHIVTNAHVVRATGRVRVQFYDGRVVPARVIGADALTDIAVLRADTNEGLFPVELAVGRAPRVGERVFAFGSPFGFKFSMSEGIISGLGRTPSSREGFGGYTNFIQHDAAVNPGNSGGPLVDVSGRVVAMNVAIVTGASPQGAAPQDAVVGDSAGISFAIPMGTIKPVVEQLIEKGRVERGFLGIVMAPPPASPVRVTAGGAVRTGVPIERTEAGSPAATAGLEPGDVILSVAGYPTATLEAVASLISSRGPGQTVELEIARGGELRTIEVLLGAISAEAIAGRARLRIAANYGVDILDTPAGPIVMGVSPNSPAYEDGLRPGQRIRAVAGEAVESQPAVYERLAREGFLEGGAVEVTVESAETGLVETLRLRQPR